MREMLRRMSFWHVGVSWLRRTEAPVSTSLAKYVLRLGNDGLQKKRPKLSAEVKEQYGLRSAKSICKHDKELLPLTNDMNLRNVVLLISLEIEQS